MKPPKKQQRPARPFSKPASGKRSRPVRPAQTPGPFTRRPEGEPSAPVKPIAPASSASARPARKPVGTFSKPFTGKSTSKPFPGKSEGKSTGRPARPAAGQPVAPPAAEPERPLAAGRHQRRERHSLPAGRTTSSASTSPRSGGAVPRHCCVSAPNTARVFRWWSRKISNV